MSRLNQEKLLKEYDSQGMIRVLDRFPSQCEDAIELGEQWGPPAIEKIDKVLVCGMGGSAMAGEIARRFARVPVFVDRSYSLPPFVDRHTFLVAVSYSGNTAETLSSLDQGRKRDIPIICISSGGKAEEIAKGYALPFLKIPAGYQPRAAMGYLTLPLLSLLGRFGILSDLGPWRSLLESLETVKSRCTWAVPSAENPAKRLAQLLFERIPCIYGTVNNTDLVAMRWKTQLNENAKQPAFWNVFPELNHNEILSMVKTILMRNHSVILLRNHYDQEENTTRMQIMQDLFAERSIPVTEITSEGESELAEILSQIYLGDYVSFYLALLNEVDPTPVALIEQFKEELATRRNGTGRSVR